MEPRIFGSSRNTGPRALSLLSLMGVIFMIFFQTPRASQL